MESTSITFGKETFIGQFEGIFLDNYDVIKQLGKGGYGKVYKIKCKKTGDIRACKHLSKLSIKYLEQFQREINILKKADHPNIIKLYDIFESKHSFYLIMEECKGGEVFDRIVEHIENKKMYSEKHAADIFVQIMSALEYCHNNGIAHRDLKPENLLYLNEGSEEENPIKVIDFGLSQVISPDRKLKTKVGTAYYVSPELLNGSYTEKCDIWSAGVILYIFLSGIPPFNGANDSDIYRKIVEMKFSFPEKHWQNISEEAKDLITHMIAPENERYNARQVLDHPWFQKAKVNTLNLVELNFNPIFFKDYVQSTFIKKLALFFIASRLEENEIEDLRKTFEAFNTQKDGQISCEELKEGLKKLNSNNIKDEDIYNLFKTIDVGKTGKIDYTEFLAATLQKRSYLQKIRLYEAFTMFDKDGCGKITKDELMEVLKLDKSQEKETEVLIKDADKDGDGVINYKEFLELMGYDDQ